MTGNEILLRNLANLKPWAKNARTHSKKQIRQVAESIKRFGFTNPILIDETDTVLAGHGRLAAAKLLGLEKVPCRRIDYMSEAEKRAYILADNKIAENAGWDVEILAGEFEAIMELDCEFDLSLTGFSSAEIDLSIDTAHPEDQGDTQDDAQPDPNAELRKVLPGDIWELGHHRLICGNALDASTVSDLMDGQKARMIFTDPPYNVPIDGHVSGMGKVKHREFAFASGEMSAEQFTTFLSTAFSHQIDHSVDGSIHFICMDWRHMSEILDAGRIYSELKNLIVWAKDNGGMGTFYRSRHELIFAFKAGDAPHLNTFELGQHGRYRTNVWEYRGMNSISQDRDASLQLHPTVKPVQMIADAIRDVSQRGDIVLDLFGGSGSTLIAAEKTARRARLCEIDPIYCARIIKRWENYAHGEAELLKRPPRKEAQIHGGPFEMEASHVG